MAKQVIKKLRDPIKINNNVIKKENMTLEQIEKASSLMDNFDNVNKKVKVVKQDRGLIERTESSKVILSEDNRQLLKD